MTNEAAAASYVVKTLNTIKCAAMVNPSTLTGDGEIFVSGNDAQAKSKVIEILLTVDLGDITTARGTEMYTALWMRLMGVLGTAQFNFRIVK